MWPLAPAAAAASSSGSWLERATERRDKEPVTARRGHQHPDHTRYAARSGPYGARSGSKQRLGQQPAYPDLWALLTGPDLVGLEVRFACGLRYVVGIGFADPAGRVVPRAEAYPILRVAWRVGERYPRAEGDTSHGRQPP
jgi:hypothetical protein